jgi:hypothetical protein
MTGAEIYSHWFNSCKSVFKKYDHLKVKYYILGLTFLEDGCFFGQNNFYDRV